MKPAQPQAAGLGAASALPRGVKLAVVGMVLVVMVGAEPQEAATPESLAPVRVTGHARGKEIQVALFEALPGVQLEIEAALFFLWMRKEALRAGIRLEVRSGFRTFREQARLYRCFVRCSCNGCRKAARPGFSAHEAGRAVDIDVGKDAVRGWLKQHASRFGFERTVRGEPWHYEYVGR